MNYKNQIENCEMRLLNESDYKEKRNNSLKTLKPPWLMSKD